MVLLLSNGPENPPNKEKLYTFKDDISNRWFEECRRLFSEIIFPTKLLFKKHTYCSSLKIALNLSSMKYKEFVDSNKKFFLLFIGL